MAAVTPNPSAPRGTTPPNPAPQGPPQATRQNSTGKPPERINAVNNTAVQTLTTPQPNLPRKGCCTKFKNAVWTVITSPWFYFLKPILLAIRSVFRSCVEIWSETGNYIPDPGFLGGLQGQNPGQNLTTLQTELAQSWQHHTNSLADLQSKEQALKQKLAQFSQQPPSGTLNANIANLKQIQADIQSLNQDRARFNPEAFPKKYEALERAVTAAKEDKKRYEAELEKEKKAKDDLGKKALNPGETRQKRTDAIGELTLKIQQAQFNADCLTTAIKFTTDKYLEATQQGMPKSSIEATENNKSLVNVDYAASFKQALVAQKQAWIAQITQEQGAVQTALDAIQTSGKPITSANDLQVYLQYQRDRSFFTNTYPEILKDQGIATLDQLITNTGDILSLPFADSVQFINGSRLKRNFPNALEQSCWLDSTFEIISGLFADPKFRNYVPAPLVIPEGTSAGAREVMEAGYRQHAKVREAFFALLRAKASTRLDVMEQARDQFINEIFPLVPDYNGRRGDMQDPKPLVNMVLQAFGVSFDAYVSWTTMQGLTSAKVEASSPIVELVFPDQTMKSCTIEEMLKHYSSVRQIKDGDRRNASDGTAHTEYTERQGIVCPDAVPPTLLTFGIKRGLFIEIDVSKSRQEAERNFLNLSGVESSIDAIAEGTQATKVAVAEFFSHTLNPARQADAKAQVAAQEDAKYLKSIFGANASTKVNSIAELFDKISRYNLNQQRRGTPETFDVSFEAVLKLETAKKESNSLAERCFGKPDAETAQKIVLFKKYLIEKRSMISQYSNLNKSRIQKQFIMDLMRQYGRESHRLNYSKETNMELKLKTDLIFKSLTFCVPLLKPDLKALNTPPEAYEAWYQVESFQVHKTEGQTMKSGHWHSVVRGPGGIYRKYDDKENNPVPLTEQEVFAELRHAVHIVAKLVPKPQSAVVPAPAPASNAAVKPPVASSAAA